MKRVTSAVLAAVLGTLLAALAPVSRPALAQTPEAVPLPPELDRVLRDYERAWSAGDEDSLARLFTDDGMALPSRQPPARGAEAIRRVYAGGSGSPLALRAFAYGMAGDLAYVIGGFGPAPGKPDFGKFVLVLRRGADGRWRIVADMDNPNGPPPGAPAGAAPGGPPPSPGPR